MVQINLDLQPSRVLYNNLIPQTLNFEYLKKREKKNRPNIHPEVPGAVLKCRLLWHSWVKGFSTHSPSEEIGAVDAFSDPTGEYL